MNRFDHWPWKTALAISKGKQFVPKFPVDFYRGTVHNHKDVKRYPVVNWVTTSFGMCIFKKILRDILLCQPVSTFSGPELVSTMWKHSSLTKKINFVQCFSLPASGAGKTELWRAEGKSRASPRPPETRAGPLLHSAQRRPAPALGMGLCSGV